MKQIRITKSSKCHGGYAFEIGDVYDVISEGQGEKKYGYMVTAKNGLPLVVYKDECEIVNAE